MRVLKINQGITLIEIMLILLFSAILVSIGWSIYTITIGKNQTIPSDESILVIENALRMYRLDNGFYPTEAQGLSALLHKPTTNPIPQHWIRYLEKLPNDAHGRSYLYKNSGEGGAIEIQLAPPSAFLRLIDKNKPDWYYWDNYNFEAA